MTAIHDLTVAQLAKGLAEKQFSSREATQQFLDRIVQHDKTYNSFITVTAEQALAEADAADARRAAGNAVFLTGVPFAHKDIFCTQGVRTSCGSKMLDNFIAPYDATVVAKYREQGMVMLGKTNMDEFAMGSSNETSFYGAVKNPWDINCVPGGSSGGSAACVAARLAPAATATDTGGSIRQPAALCGITGLKPTYGRVSRWGMIAFASSLDQAGPMARTAEDVALLLGAMAGFDAKDSTCLDREVPDYCASLNNDLTGLKIGVPKEYFGAGLNAQTAECAQAALREYEKLGATLVEISLPHSHLAVPAYYVIAPAECSANLSRFDGVRYGYRCDNPQDLSDLYCRSRAEGFGEEVVVAHADRAQRIAAVVLAGQCDHLGGRRERKDFLQGLESFIGGVRVGRQAQIQRGHQRFVPAKLRDGRFAVVGEDHVVPVERPAHLLLQTQIVFHHQQCGSVIRHVIVP